MGRNVQESGRGRLPSAGPECRDPEMRLWLGLRSGAHGNISFSSDPQTGCNCLVLWLSDFSRPNFQRSAETSGSQSASGALLMSSGLLTGRPATVVHPADPVT